LTLLVALLGVYFGEKKLSSFRHISSITIVRSGEFLVCVLLGTCVTCPFKGELNNKRTEHLVYRDGSNIPARASPQVRGRG
jgi:hypothetical protein